MYAVKDLPVRLVVVQRRTGLSVVLKEGDEERTRTNTHKLNSHLLPALSSLPLSPYSSPSHPPRLLNPPHHPHKHRLKAKQEANLEAKRGVDGEGDWNQLEEQLKGRKDEPT